MEEVLRSISPMIQGLIDQPPICEIIFKQLTTSAQEFIMRCLTLLRPTQEEMSSVEDCFIQIDATDFNIMDRCFVERIDEELVLLNDLGIMRKSEVISQTFLQNLDIALQQFRSYNCFQSRGKQKIKYYDSVQSLEAAFEQVQDAGVIGDIKSLFLTHCDFKFAEQHRKLLQVNDNRGLLKVLGIRRADASQASTKTSQQFALGSTFDQVTIVLKQLFGAFGQVESYSQLLELLPQSIVPTKLEPSQLQQIRSRSVGRETQQKIAQKQAEYVAYLLKLLNLPPYKVFSINGPAPYPDVFFWLRAADLLYEWKAGEISYFVLSDAFSLLQFSDSEREFYLKTFNQQAAKAEEKCLIVESTGRIYYQCKLANPGQDQIFRQLLEFFCKFRAKLPHQLIFEIDQQTLQQTGVNAGLIAHFLRNKSVFPVPADIINQLASWEKKVVHLKAAKAALLKFQASSAPTLASRITALSYLLVVRKLKEMQKLLFATVDPGVKKFEGMASAAQQLVKQLKDRPQEDYSRKMAEIYGYLKDQPLSVVFDQNAAEKIGDLLKEIRAAAEDQDRFNQGKARK